MNTITLRTEPTRFLVAAPRTRAISVPHPPATPPPII